jgi:manganese transport protein
MFTMDKRKLGDFTAPLWISGLAILIAIILITLNMKMLWDVASDTFLG